jgi:tetratricopeptide (TPR) repeat protein
MVQESLKAHFATGRLWAILIQLQHSRSQTVSDFKTAHETFERALLEIPKSGEVWCEGARLAMSNHPNNCFYNLDKALKYIDFAIQFTPQYGDSFLEMIKLCELMKQNNKYGIQSINKILSKTR